MGLRPLLVASERLYKILLCLYATFLLRETVPLPFALRKDLVKLVIARNAPRFGHKHLTSFKVCFTSFFHFFSPNLLEVVVRNT